MEEAVKYIHQFPFLLILVVLGLMIGGITSMGYCMYVLLSGCRWMNMICLQSMAPSKQFGNDIRSGGVSKVYGKINIMNSLISRGYTSGLIINIDDLSVDSSSTVASKKGGKK